MGYGSGPHVWQREPEAGTRICLGFDGSETDDYTVIRAETIDGHQFTPRFGPSRHPTVWIPAECYDHRTPRPEVHAAMAELFDTYEIERVYCDPPLWATEIDDWAGLYGEKKIVRFATFRPAQIHTALERFVTDLISKRITHDGCPITQVHISNARKVARGRDVYVLAKPSNHQKIDAAMASVLAHEAAADSRASGWGDPTDSRMFVFR